MAQSGRWPVGRLRPVRSPSSTTNGREVKGLLWFVLLCGMAASFALPTSANESAADCLVAMQDNLLLGSQRYSHGVVGFVGVETVIGIEHGNDVTGNEIQVIRFRDRAGCAAEPVDTYHYNGGEPTLEAAFMHPVQGVPNLFAIVSWPLVHVGLGMSGSYYAVHAYHEIDGALVVNELVVKDTKLHGGVEGILEGEPTTFGGTTEQGVGAMLKRRGLE